MSINSPYRVTVLDCIEYIRPESYKNLLHFNINQRFIVNISSKRHTLVITDNKGHFPINRVSAAESQLHLSFAFSYTINTYT